MYIFYFLFFFQLDEENCKESPNGEYYTDISRNAEIDRKDPLMFKIALFAFANITGTVFLKRNERRK